MILLVSNTIYLSVQLPVDPILLNNVFARTFLLSFLLILERLLRKTITYSLNSDLLLASRCWAWLGVLRLWPEDGGVARLDNA